MAEIFHLQDVKKIKKDSFHNRGALHEIFAQGSSPHNEPPEIDTLKIKK